MAFSVLQSNSARWMRSQKVDEHANEKGDTEMNKTLATLFTLAAVAALPLYVCADEGKTPIYEPTVITDSGSYVVTRDIVAAGTIIDINRPAEPDIAVTIDLNGYTLENTDAATPVVDASGFFDIFLTNGTLKGGSNGFHTDNGPIKARVRIENMAIKGANGNGIHVVTTGPSGSSMNVKASKVSNAGGNGIFASTAGGAIDIADSTVEDAGVDGIALVTTGSIRVEDNTLRDITATGLSITGAQGAVIANNQIFNIAPNQIAISIVKAAAAVDPEWGNQIRGNTLSGSPAISTSVGIYIGPEVKGNILSENVVTQFGNGIQVVSGNNIIRDNNIGGSHGAGIVIVDSGDGDSNGNTIQQNNVGGSGGAGIEVGGEHNIVRENQCQGNMGPGVSSPLSTENFFISNMLRGNTGNSAFGGGDVAVAGTIDDGGNIVNP